MDQKYRYTARADRSQSPRASRLAWTTNLMSSSETKIAPLCSHRRCCRVRCGINSLFGSSRRISSVAWFVRKLMWVQVHIWKANGWIWVIAEISGEEYVIKRNTFLWDGSDIYCVVRINQLPRRRWQDALVRSCLIHTQLYPEWKHHTSHLLTPSITN